MRRYPLQTGFIDNETDAKLLTEHGEDFAAAIARGVTDWGQCGQVLRGR